MRDSYRSLLPDVLAAAKKAADPIVVPPEVQQVVQSIQVPEGFQKTVEMPYVNKAWNLNFQDEEMPGARVWLKSADIDLEIYVEAFDKKRHDYLYDKLGPVVWWGHTNFRVDGKGFTFTHRGVDVDSFSGGTAPSGYRSDSDKDINTTITEQIERARKQIDAHKGGIQLTGPLSGFNISQERMKAYQSQLKSGKSITLMPGGFGTGWTLSTKRPRSQYGVRQMPAEVAKAFGVPVLYGETFDAD